MADILGNTTKHSILKQEQTNELLEGIQTSLKDALKVGPSQGRKMRYKQVDFDVLHTTCPITRAEVS